MKWMCKVFGHKEKADEFTEGNIYSHCIRCGEIFFYKVPFQWDTHPKKPSCYSWGKYVLDDGTLKRNKTDDCETCPVKWACGHAVSMRIGWAKAFPIPQIVKLIEEQMS